MHPPPVDLSAPQTGSLAFSIVCTAIFAGATVWALHRARHGDMLGILALVAGLITSLIEPMLDNLGLLWFAADNELIVFEAYSRHMPLFLVMGYGFFFGAEAYIGYYALVKGRGARWLWGLYWFAWVFDLALESTGHWIGLYKYYGPQPFNVWGIPLWWMFINPALPIAAGAVFYALRRQLRGVRALLVLPLLPMSYGAVYGATCWPIFTALNSNVSTFVIYVAAIATIFQALLLVSLTIRGVEWLRGRAGEATEPAGARLPEEPAISREPSLATP